MKSIPRSSFCRQRILIAACAIAICGAVQRGQAQVAYELVTVGNAGNAAGSTGYEPVGAVSYEYQIGKYEVTIGQYTAFLNAVANSDAHGLWNSNMETNPTIAGISRSGTAGSYIYGLMQPSGVTPPGASSADNRPITYVSWFDAARFANWMANGQPQGVAGVATTEDGVYNLQNWANGVAPQKNAVNPNTSLPPTYWIPTQSEWWKAAYYSPVLNSGSGGYYAYATQSNSFPGNSVGATPNQGNFKRDQGLATFFAVTQAGFTSNQNYLTEVGAFASSASYYGTFDQNGNLIEWNDLDGVASNTRGIRGRSWGEDGYSDLQTTREGSRQLAIYGQNGDGFRLASPVPVPEPSTWVMGLAGIACGGWQVFRRGRARS